MTSVQLATMSTALWVVATVSLFILLAEWSSGASWGLTSSIVRGVRGWADHDPPATAVSSPFIDPLAPVGPLVDPSRPIGGAAAARLPAADRPSDQDAVVIVEIVDLGERRLPR